MAQSSSQIKELLLLSVLWLPLAFFLWFMFGSPIVLPASTAAEWVLTTIYPQFIYGLEQVRADQLDVFLALATPELSAETDTSLGDYQKVLTISVNPMIYAYGVPLLFGLVMATPLTGWQRVRQFLLGWAIILPVQVWGIFWDVMKSLIFRTPEVISNQVVDGGVSPTLVALCYQFGYLILPAVTPIIVWILSNRVFLEGVVGFKATRKPAKRSAKAGKKKPADAVQESVSGDDSQAGAGQ